MSNTKRYKPISPVRNLTRSCHDYRIIMPRRGKKKPKKKTSVEQNETRCDLRLREERHQLMKERDLLMEERQRLTNERLLFTNERHQLTNDHNHLTGATLNNQSLGRSENLKDLRMHSTTTQPVLSQFSKTFIFGKSTMESGDPVLVRGRIERNREEYLRKYKLSDKEVSTLGAN